MNFNTKYLENDALSCNFNMNACEAKKFVLICYIVF